MGLAVVNGQLYAVGGFDGTTYLKTVEVYERESNSWRHSGNMNYRRLGGGVGVVRLANDHMTHSNFAESSSTGQTPSVAPSEPAIYATAVPPIGGPSAKR